MARKPLGPCKVRTCSGRATHGRYCADHAHLGRRRDDRPSAARRGYDRKWRRIRAAFIKANPYCAVCGAPTEEVDHIIPRAVGGSNDWSNLQPLCKIHHSQKTALQDGGFGRDRE